MKCEHRKSGLKLLGKNGACSCFIAILKELESS